MEFGLQDKIALVTGGSYGIGRAIALALADEGCRVAICARGKERLDKTTADIPGCLAIQADATNADDIRRVIDTVVKAWGTLHILVNNVGGGGGRTSTPVEKTGEEVWQQVYASNAVAATRFTMLTIPYMRKQKWGRVVTITSVKGREGGGRPWYNMAKAAEISLMKTLALDPDLAHDGITFNSIVSGRVLYPGNEWDVFRQEDPVRFDERMKRDMPLGRPGTPEEIASAVAFVCSEKASFVNGAAFAVDGGESRSF